MIKKEEVVRLLDYDPVTGIFKWKVWRQEVKAGVEAGCVGVTRQGKSYRTITINGRSYHAHRLAWLIIAGEFPENDIDHISGDGLDNRAVNLRAVTRKENGKNQRRHITNSSGVTGVYWYKASSKWCARIKHDGK